MAGSVNKKAPWKKGRLSRNLHIRGDKQGRLPGVGNSSVTAEQREGRWARSGKVRGQRFSMSAERGAAQNLGFHFDSNRKRLCCVVCCGFFTFLF